LSTAKWIAVVLLVAGVGLLIFGLLGFQTGILGESGYYYRTEAKIQAALGGVLFTAGVLVLKLERP